MQPSLVSHCLDLIISHAYDPSCVQTFLIMKVDRGVLPAPLVDNINCGS